MEVSIGSIIEVLNEVEGSLKKALYDASCRVNQLAQKRIENALEDVQDAITELLKIS